MKSIIPSLSCLLLAVSMSSAFGAELPPSGTNTIQGQVSFLNVDPDILARLGPPGNEGMDAFSIFAYTDPPEVLQSSKNFNTVDALSSPYSLTVGALNTPLSYHVFAYVILDSNEEYWTDVQAASPVTSNSAPATVMFNECVALVELRYQDAAGQPVAALGGRATVTETGPPNRLRARYASRPAGQTGNFLVVPSGVALELVVEVDTGTDIYSDRLTHRETHVMTAACDEKPVLTITIPDSGRLGKIVGRANFVDEIEPFTEGYQDLLGRPVIRAAGPSGNQRYDALPGELPGADAIRTFSLENLVPSLGTETWRVQAEMQFGQGHRFQYFQTPALGAGVNPGVEVTAGDTTDLADAFVMTPARLVGKITLSGPLEAAGGFSALRGLSRATDNDADADGIPDGVGPYGIYGSYVNVTGVDQLAPGSTRATTGGSSAASFEGGFNPATASFEGDYEAALGMLDDQPGIWRQDSLSYTIYMLATNGAPFVNQVGNVAENLPWQATLAPGERATNDLHYGFAEVCLHLKSPAPFFNPMVNASGGLDGFDSQGQFRSYRVGGDFAYGQPDNAEMAQVEGLVTLYLPEGTYTLRPTITTVDAGGGQSVTQLPAIEVTVTAGEQLCVEDCIQVSIDVTGCTPTYGFLATANAFSCDGTLTNLSLRASPLSDPSIRLGYSDIRILIGSRTNLTTAHGLFPTFDGFPREMYKDIVYVATAVDKNGRVATRRIIAHYDLTPPVMEVPADITVTAANGVSATIDYAARITDGPGTLLCAPPSGSGFSVGTHTVKCSAYDYCYNTNTTSFRVTVLPPACPLGIELASVAPRRCALTWDCGGLLQSAPDLSGPWTDIAGAASPQLIDAADPQSFFRLRFLTAGHALQFFGVAGAVATATQNNGLDSLPLTVTAWIKTTQTIGAYPGLVTKYSSSIARGYGLALNAGRLAPWYYAASGLVEPGFTGANDRFVADGAWHHVAFVVDSSSARTYIDGQVVNTQPWTGTFGSGFNSEPLRFGAYAGGSSLPYRGELDEVTLWNVALDDSQIGEAMTTGPAVDAVGLLGYWRFDEGAGAVANSRSFRNLNMSVGAGVGWSVSSAPVAH